MENPVEFPYPKVTQIPGARSPWRLIFVLWRLMFVGPNYVTCFMSSFGA